MSQDGPFTPERFGVRQGQEPDIHICKILNYAYNTNANLGQVLRCCVAFLGKPGEGFSIDQREQTLLMYFPDLFRRKRLVSACESCRRRKVACQPDPNGQEKCLSCSKRGTMCLPATYNKRSSSSLKENVDDASRPVKKMKRNVLDVEYADKLTAFSPTTKFRANAMPNAASSSMMSPETPGSVTRSFSIFTTPSTSGFAGKALISPSSSTSASSFSYVSPMAATAASNSTPPFAPPFTTYALSNLHDSAPHAKFAGSATNPSSQIMPVESAEHEVFQSDGNLSTNNNGGNGAASLSPPHLHLLNGPENQIDPFLAQYHLTGPGPSAAALPPSQDASSSTIITTNNHGHDGTTLPPQNFYPFSGQENVIDPFLNYSLHTSQEHSDVTLRSAQDASFFADTATTNNHEVNALLLQPIQHFNDTHTRSDAHDNEGNDAFHHHHFEGAHHQHTSSALGKQKDAFLPYATAQNATLAMDPALVDLNGRLGGAGESGDADVSGSKSNDDQFSDLVDQFMLDEDWENPMFRGEVSGTQEDDLLLDEF